VDPIVPSGDTVPMRGPPSYTPATIAHFELGRQLGRGGMGVVYEARDVLLERPVALKLMSGQRARTASAQARVLREGQALARLKHPNVVTVYEIGIADGQAFIAMELLGGATLRDWLDQPRDWRAIVDVFLAAGRGLAATHALGLVHRDVKPANILLDRDGTPKLGDFGVVAIAGAGATTGSAIAARARTLTTTGSVMGTPAYMAPEQLEGRPADPRADQYAFCVSLVEGLTGAVPGDRAAVLRVPARLRPILGRGLDLDPTHRFPSMLALLAELERARASRAARYATAIVGAIGAGTALARLARLAL
jgi:serine/threonine protein kinase